MGDGISEARNDDQKVLRVEEAAAELVAALKETGDPMFCLVNPAAIRYANEVLREAGVKLQIVTQEHMENV